MKKTFLSLAIFLAITVMAPSVHAYTDISTKSEAIDFMTKENIMQGYPDKTFRPGNSITRAEFLKVLVGSKTKEPLEKYSANCFPDVEKSAWYSKYVCYAKTQGLVKGQQNGKLKPNDPINTAEAVQILATAFQLEKDSNLGKYWYSNALGAMVKSKFLPSSIRYINQELTRGEIAEILWLMITKTEAKNTVDAATIENNYCQKSTQNLLPKVDLAKVRTTWLDWYNKVRAEQGLNPYIYNDQLNRTATVWSEYAQKRGYIDHKRSNETAYYDYRIITSWFEDLGVQFQNTNGVTYSENVAWGPYQCTAEDCTEELTKAIRLGYNFFMSEKGKSYSPHYDSVVSPNFKEIGLGISIDPTKKRFYLTVHYATALTSKVLPACHG